MSLKQSVLATKTFLALVDSIILLNSTSSTIKTFFEHDSAKFDTTCSSIFVGWQRHISAGWNFWNGLIGWGDWGWWNNNPIEIPDQR